MARPMPLLAPVTTARLVLSPRSMGTPLPKVVEAPNGAFGQRHGGGIDGATTSSGTVGEPVRSCAPDPQVRQNRSRWAGGRAVEVVMIEPYNAVGLVTTVWGISKRSEIMRNIDHHRHMVKAASWLASLDLPVRLVALPEGALQGFNDEVLDLDHATFADTCAIDVPGPETAALGEICREYGVFLVAQ